MARPRKYGSDADARAAKLEKQRQRRAAKHALKNDPTKRKDAAVNAETYPFAPVNAETMAVIQRIKEAAGALDWDHTPDDLCNARAAAAMMLEWEEATKTRLPVLEEETVHCGHTKKGVPITYQRGEGHEWNRLNSYLRVVTFFMERSGRNKLKAERHAEREQAIAEAEGLTVTELRTRDYALARQKWERRTQAAYHLAKSEKAVAKRSAQIRRQDAERMKKHATFGRF